MMFGQGRVRVAPGARVVKGKVGSDGNVRLGDGTKVSGGVTGGGKFFSGGKGVKVRSLVFSGDVWVGQRAAVKKSVHSGGNAFLRYRSNVGKNVKAAGTVFVHFTAKVGGKVVKYGKPAKYKKVTLPKVTPFSSGGQDVAGGALATVTLKPGSYRYLMLGAGCTLNLSAGDYFFTRFRVGPKCKLKLDVKGGVVRIFVAKNMRIGAWTVATLKGGGARRVYAEVHGNVRLGSHTTWRGTVFAPFGDIKAYNKVKVVGALWAKGLVRVGLQSHLKLKPYPPRKHLCPGYAVFGAGAVALGTKARVLGGPLASNTSVNLSGGAYVEQAVGSGGKYSAGTKAQVGASATANGACNMAGGASVGADLDCGGNAAMGTKAQVKGDLTAAGSVHMTGGASVGGTVTAQGKPKAYSPAKLPPATTFTTGGAKVARAGGSVATLAPGSYGAVSVGTKSTLHLSAGDYYLDSLAVSGGSKVIVDLSGGRLRLFVSGNLALGTKARVVLNGGAPSRVMTEVHGKFSLSGGAVWAGLVFAPKGDIALGTKAQLQGQLVAGGKVSLSGGSTVEGKVCVYPYPF